MCVKSMRIWEGLTDWPVGLMGTSHVSLGWGQCRKGSGPMFSWRYSAVSSLEFGKKNITCVTSVTMVMYDLKNHGNVWPNHSPPLEVEQEHHPWSWGVGQPLARSLRCPWRIPHGNEHPKKPGGWRQKRRWKIWSQGILAQEYVWGWESTIFFSPWE